MLVPSRESIQIRFQGPALDAGSMDVRELAPALLALGELLQSASKAAYGEKSLVSVSVKATEKGSFSVDLEVAQSIYEATKSFLQGEDYATAKELCELLFGGGVAGVSLIKVIKWLRGRKPTNLTRISNGNIKIEVSGESVEVKPQIVQIFNDIGVQRALPNVISPVRADGIDRLSIMRGNTEVEFVTKGDIVYFDPEVYEEIDSPPESESERTAAFEVVTLSFRERYKWRFTDGDAVFTADIEDESFFERVQSGKVVFGKGDILRVKLKTKTVRTGGNWSSPDFVDTPK